MEDRLHVLLVAETNGPTDQTILDETVDIFADDRTRFSLLYVIPRVPSHYYQLPSMVMFQTKLFREAQETLEELGDFFRIPMENRYIEVGKLKRVMNRVSHQFAVDVTHILGNRMPVEEKAPKKAPAAIERGVINRIAFSF